MTTGTSIDVREVIFINDSAEDAYEELPEKVGDIADRYIDDLQNNRSVPGTVLKPLKDTLKGIDELKLPYDTNTYRVYVWLGCPPAVFLLDAGIKKSPKGRAIPQWQKDRLAKRLGDAKEFSESAKKLLAGRFAARTKRRQDLKE